MQALSNVGINNYTFDNTQLLSAKNYYRLKQIDNDGKFIYSNIILLNKAGDSNQWSVFPNPVNNTLHAQNNAVIKNVQVILMTSEGKILLTKNIVGSSNHFDIDVKTIPVGLYMLKIIDGTKIEIIKIIRQ